MDKGNLLALIPARAQAEISNDLVHQGSFKIQRIVSFGQSSPEGFWYDQDFHEWVIVLRGRAGLQFADRDEILELEVGDYVNIPAHVRHRVAWTAAAEPTVWLAVHYADR